LVLAAGGEVMLGWKSFNATPKEQGQAGAKIKKDRKENV
jgi:hypothetical protein